jgi:hypothetical protein
VVGPAGIPAPIVKLLNDPLAVVVRAADLCNELVMDAMEPIVILPEQFAACMKTSTALGRNLPRIKILRWNESIYLANAALVRLEFNVELRI